MPSYALQWATTSDLPRQTFLANVNEALTINFTQYSGSTDVTGYTLKLTLSAFPNEDPVVSLGDAAFSGKTSGGAFTCSIDADDTQPLPSRAYYFQVLRTDVGFEAVLSHGWITLYSTIEADAEVISFTKQSLANGGTEADLSTTRGILVQASIGAPVTTLYSATTSLFVRADGTLAAPTAAAWGSITGTLSAQADLQAALDAKVPTSRTLTINGTTYDLSADRSWTITAGVSSVDGQTGAVSLSSTYLALSGGTMTGNINLNGHWLSLLDSNWRIGLIGSSAFTTSVVGNSNCLQIVTGGGAAPDGFAVGPNGGASVLEVDCNGQRVWTRGTLDVGGDLYITGIIDNPKISHADFHNTDASNLATLQFSNNGSNAIYTASVNGALFMLSAYDVNDDVMRPFVTLTAGNVPTCDLAASTTLGGAAIATTAFVSSGYQPLDADLTAIAALTTDSFGRALLTKTDAAAVRTYIGAGTSSFDGAYSSLSGIPSTFAPSAHASSHAAAGSDPITISESQVTNLTSDLAAKQPLDATLTAFAALTIAADSLTIGTGADTFSQTTFAANTFPAKASTGNLVAKTITDFGLSLVDDTDASAARTTLGLGSLATQSGTFSGTSSGTNTGDQLVFKTISVSGQSDVVADSTTDTLTLAAGTNITITTDASTDTITIAAASAGTPTAITVANEASDTTCFPLFTTAATGDLGPKTNAGLTFDSSTGTLAATAFSGPLTGNVTGNVSGSSGSCTGNAATATSATSATTATNATNTAITDDTTTNATMYPTWVTTTTGNLPQKISSTKLTFNPSTGTLTATAFSGPLTGNVTGNASGSSGSCTGNAATATALQNTRTIGGSNFDGTGNVTSFPSPGAIGGTTPAAGTFTTLTGTSGSISGLTTLAIRDTSAAFDVTLAATSSTTLTAGRTLTFDVTNAARTIKLTGNPTLADWFDQSVKSGASPTFVTVTAALSGNATTATTLATARAIYGNNFDGSAALTQVIASTYGGTGNGFTKFSGPTTAEKTFTLPDASATLLYSGGALGTPSSGTLTNCSGLPVSGITASTSTALGVGSIELGHATDTTISRVSPGVIAVEGTNVVLAGAATSSGLTMSTARLLGRTTASSGAIEEITVGTGLSLSAGSLTATGGGGTPGGSNTQLQYNNSSAFGGISGVTSDGTSITATAGNLKATSPRFTTDISDSNGNEVIKITATASAVNEITVTNAATGNSPTISATGGDSNISLTLAAKGTGSVKATQGSNTFDIVSPGICQGRLTLESGVPVSTTDQTGKTTIYFTPYNGSTVALYDGSTWAYYSFTEVSLALGTLTSGKNYDVFLYNNSGTLTLELSAAWTSDTARNDAVSTQNGVYVKSSATTRRLLGTIRTTATTTTEDSLVKRFVVNVQNLVNRPILVNDTTDSWTYQTATWRQRNGSTANQFAFIVPISGIIHVNVTDHIVSSHGAGDTRFTGLGLDSTTAPSSESANGYAIGGYTKMTASYASNPTVGYHYLAQLEQANAGATCTWLGDGGTTVHIYGMRGTVTT